VNGKVWETLQSLEGSFFIPTGIWLMVSVVGRIFTVVGLVLLVAAWLWWLYLYRAADSIGCLYMPGCVAPDGSGHTFALPAYEPMVLWAGAAAVLLGFVLRLVSRA
jgi:hypothetical protein